MLAFMLPACPNKINAAVLRVAHPSKPCEPDQDGVSPDPTSRSAGRNGVLDQRSRHPFPRSGVCGVGSGSRFYPPTLLNLSSLQLPRSSDSPFRKRSGKKNNCSTTSPVAPVGRCCWCSTTWSTYLFTLPCKMEKTKPPYYYSGFCRGCLTLRSSLPHGKGVIYAKNGSSNFTDCQYQQAIQPTGWRTTAA